MRRDIVKGVVGYLGLGVATASETFASDYVLRMAAGMAGLLVSLAMFISLVYSIGLKKEQLRQLREHQIRPDQLSDKD